MYLQGPPEFRYISTTKTQDSQNRQAYLNVHNDQHTYKKKADGIVLDDNK